MTKQEIIKIFNASVLGKPVTYNKLISLISEYLEDIKNPHVDKFITFLSNNPEMLTYTIPTLIKHFTSKYNIYSLISENKVLLYYE